MRVHMRAPHLHRTLVRRVYNKNVEQKFHSSVHLARSADRPDRPESEPG